MQASVDALSLSGVASLVGSSSATKTTPSVICEADSFDGEDPLYSGNFHVQARVTVTSQAASNGLNDHQDLVTSVFDAFAADDIAATLSAAMGSYNVFPEGVTITGRENDNNDTQFVDSLLLDVYCCASDFTA